MKKILLLEILNNVADKVGFKESLRNQCQRLVSLLKDDKVSKDVIKPGTPLLVDLSMLVEHSGIYLGNGRVAELHGSGLLRVVSLKEFINGDSWSIREPLAVRTGRRVYAACSKDTGTPVCSVNASFNAWAYIRGKRTVEYNLVKNNCHLFCISCVSGKFQEERKILETFRQGGVSIGTLTNAISYFLNNDKLVVWKPVEGWERKKLDSIVDFSQECDSEAEESVGKRICEMFSSDANTTVSNNEPSNNDVLIAITRMNANEGVFAPLVPFLAVMNRCMRDKELRAKLPKKVIPKILFALAYLICPLDLIPDALPVIGFGDDVSVILYILNGIIHYLSKVMSDDNVRQVMATDSYYDWIHKIGRPECIRTIEYSVMKPSTSFKVSVGLLKYLIKWYKLPDPQVSCAEKNDVMRENMVDKHGWREITKKGKWPFPDTCHIRDPFDKIWVKGKKETMDLTFKNFVVWYNNKLLPAILNDSRG